MNQQSVKLNQLSVKLNQLSVKLNQLSVKLTNHWIKFLPYTWLCHICRSNTQLRRLRTNISNVGEFHAKSEPNTCEPNQQKVSLLILGVKIQ